MYSHMSGGLRSFCAWYSHQLQVNPYKTNCITYGVMYMLVEITQQKFLQKPNESDLRKVVERGLLGTFIQGPLITSWFRWLDWQFPGTSAVAIAKKIGLTQILLAPISNLSFFVSLGILDQSDDVLQEAIDNVPIAYIGGIVFWIPITLINFRFVPQFYRIVYNCLMGFFWTNVMFYIKQRGCDPVRLMEIKTAEEKRRAERKQLKEGRKNR